MKKTAMAVNHIKKGIDRSLGPSPWDAALKVDLNMHAYMEAFKVHLCMHIRIIFRIWK
jgi:hypothetical protein